ncbi:spermatogenesis-associated protein 7 [Alosa pseudoharengus]|uniref:spermatogenesis-associated protein 7 n=1 Tax=Alosa pseudoharengus TaxID=34774 RepID=UPI003F89DBAE
MGFKNNTTMDAKRAYCPGASGNLTKQCLVQDHMFAHYRKVYTAKAAVDTSAPKSMQSSIKYSDQKRRERLKREASQRSLSSRSLRSRLDNTRESCSLKASRTSLQADEDGCHYLGGSVMSSPRLNTSFHIREIAYPPQRATTAGSTHNCHRYASEFNYRDPHPQKQQFLRSCGTTGSQSAFKAFQDPVQKTYSGDLMLKHSKHFKPEKPFTPRTLKKDSKSYLSQYRFYTPPRRKASEETSPRLVQQDSSRGSSEPKDNFAAEWDLPQTFDLESEIFDEDTSPYGKHSKVNKTKGSSFLSSSRMSPDGIKSPIMRKVNEEEEELLYLEFIADVTNEILTLGLYNDRVLRRVFQRHIDTNKHHLDEDKMRHLLDILHHDIQSPSNASTFCVHPAKKHREKDTFPQDVPSFSSDLTSQPKLVHRPSSSTMFDRDLESLGKRNHLIVSTPLQRSPTSNTSYSLQGETEDGNLRYSLSSYSSHALDRGTEDRSFKFDPTSYSSHDLDREIEGGPLDFNLARYSSDVPDKETEEDLLDFNPARYSSDILDKETEDGLLQYSPDSHSSHVLDGETDDCPRKSSPTNYSSPGLDGETEDGQEQQNIREDDLSPGTEHNHLTPEENEALQSTEDNNELSGELEELGLNMESLHVSQTPPKTIKDEQDFSIFSDDEF